MPHSSAEGKVKVIHWLQDLKPESVLDVGCGAGVYGKLARQVGATYLHGIEIHEPYVKEFSLSQKYDALTIADARSFVRHLSDALPNSIYDLVILGDVIEHMDRQDALELWLNCRDIASNIILSLPIVHYPQGEQNGNPFERHVVDDWSHSKVMEAFPGIRESWTGTEIGVYRAS